MKKEHKQYIIDKFPGVAFKQARIIGNNSDSNIILENFDKNKHLL